eukprot:CAMPEP_0205998080 /NCGR_PEP_ID=MMETSP1464-20131121/39_1 /ASSEMBLY_ACC=CAM_ASM_001124 /TAXON_ID=119497 /ORGANISM="Exanthemachrysis gayraliae, Strain RCC1523" /LENGTH=129 /DNA_ID=CAMNT_0053371217 /DNA_START=67 /DNA_END=457 /DNA_ORIENTATION=-
MCHGILTLLTQSKKLSVVAFSLSMSSGRAETFLTAEPPRAGETMEPQSSARDGRSLSAIRIGLITSWVMLGSPTGAMLSKRLICEPACSLSSSDLHVFFATIKGRQEARNLVTARVHGRCRVMAFDLLP